MVEVSSSSLNIAQGEETSSLAVEADADMDTTQKATKERTRTVWIARVMVLSSSSR